MSRYQFFTTEGCHLCEQAWQQVLLLGLQNEMTTVEIIHDETHVERYGIRIPVILDTMTEREIGWPFDVELLAKFIAEA